MGLHRGRGAGVQACMALANGSELEGQIPNGIFPLAGQAACNDDLDFVNGLADRQPARDNDGAGHLPPGRNTICGVPRHGLPIVREKDTIFVRSPSQELRVRSRAVSYFMRRDCIEVGDAANKPP